MSKPSLVIVILEDDHHRTLIRRHLRDSGLRTHHQIRILLSRSGRGSAERWVRKAFVAETEIYRTRQAQTALIVMIDADIYSVQDRLAQLDQALKDAGRQAIDRSERIARLVPKRNVETWTLSLNGKAVDEATDYKNTVRDWNPLIRNASRTLNELARSRAESTKVGPDSLRHGIDELKRLDL